MSRFRLAATTVAVAGALLVPAAAEAAVTSSTVTSVDAQQQPHMSDDRDQASTATANLITVHATTDGTTGDNAKIICSSRGATINATLVASTPVAADGSVTYTGSIRNIYTYLNECDLRVIPAGTVPSDLSRYTPKRIQVGEHQSYKQGTGANAGQVTDYWIDGSGDKAGAGYNSIGGCGLCDMSLHDPLTLNQSPELYGSNAALFYGPVTAGGGSRPSAKIDGAPAYVTSAAYMTNPAASGVTPMVYTQSVDPVTGDLTIHETDVVVTCPTYPVTNGSSDCPTFTNSGVTIERTIKQNHEGSLVAITDKLESADGNAHSYDFDYFEWIGSQGGYQFPGESGFSTHATNDVVAGTSGPASVSQFILNNSSAPSFNNPLGFMVTTPAADSYSFGTPSSFYDRQTGTIPANGSTLVRHIYGMAANTSDQAQLKADAVDIYVEPSVTLTTPPATTTSNQVTLTGTASAMGTLTGVKVNGLDATVDGGGHWTVTIPLAQGENAISVIATNSAGLTHEATGTIRLEAAATPTPTPTATPTVPEPTPTATPTATPIAPVPTPTSSTPTPPSTPNKVSVKLQTKTATVTKGSRRETKLALTCSGDDGACAGSLKVVKTLKVNGVRQPVVLGTATYSISAGDTSKVTLKLSSIGKRVLTRHWSRIVHVDVTVTPNGKPGTQQRIAIRRTTKSK